MSRRGKGEGDFHLTCMQIVECGDMVSHFVLVLARYGDFCVGVRAWDGRGGPLGCRRK
jgi:hypothetical protein